MTLLSLRNRPIHHDPSPAFKHSIKSPSIKPKSRFDCAIVWLELQTVENRNVHWTYLSAE